MAATLQQATTFLERGLEGVSARVDGLVAGGVGGGAATGSRPASGDELPRSVRLEKPKPFDGNTSDPAVLDSFLYACELYFELTRVTRADQQATLSLLWLEGDAAIWWQTVRSGHPAGTLTWQGLKGLLTQQFRPVDAARCARDAWALCV